MKNIPNHKHDCDNCTHLGSSESTDYYVCRRGTGSFNTTLIARYSSDGPDYGSGVQGYTINPHINLAGNLALDQGLITIKEINQYCPVEVTERITIPFQ